MSLTIPLHLTPGTPSLTPAAAQEFVASQMPAYRRCDADIKMERQLQEYAASAGRQFTRAQAEGLCHHRIAPSDRREGALPVTAPAGWHLADCCH